MSKNPLFEIEGTKLVKYLGNEKNVAIPNGITDIGSMAFHSNKNIISVSFPDSVQRIEYAAFSYCDNLRHLSLGKGLMQIRQAFDSCGNLSMVMYNGTIADWCLIDIQAPISKRHSLVINNQFISNLVIPEGIIRIGENTFYGCIDIFSISLPKSVEKIDCGAFAYCSNLSEINVHKDNKRYKFANGCLIDKKDKAIILGTSKCDISDDMGINKIAESAFEGCAKLKFILIKDCISSIGAWAFYHCENLEKVLLFTKNLKMIEAATFYGCPKLEYIYLPLNLERIKEYAFAYCNKLRIIRLPEGLIELGDCAFAYCESLDKLVIPKSLKSIDIISDSPFFDSGIETFYYRGDKKDWDNIDVFNPDDDTTDMEDIIEGGEVVFNYVDNALTTDVNEELMHCGDLVEAGEISLLYSCDNESITIKVKSIFNDDFIKNKKIRIWIKNVGVRTIDGSEEILKEYHLLCELNEANEYQCYNASVTISESKFKQCWLAPYGIENFPYDDDLCCAELFFTLVADLGDHDIEESEWIINSEDIEIEGEFEVINDIDDLEFTSNDILYIYKGNIRCHKYNHHIIQATAILHSQTDKEIELNVEYCTECKKYLLEYNLFEQYRKRYGILIGNLRIITNGDFDGEYDLALESPLKLSGYNVSQKDGFSSSERHYILARIIHDGIMEKGEVIRYLSYFISRNGAKYGNELAVEKWEEDLAFVQEYDINIQPRTIISEIKKYGK